MIVTTHNHGALGVTFRVMDSAGWHYLTVDHDALPALAEAAAMAARGEYDDDQTTEG